MTNADNWQAKLRRIYWQVNREIVRLQKMQQGITKALSGLKPERKRRLSPQGLRAIRVAQKKRWAKVKR